MLRLEEVGKRTLLKATRLGRIACRRQLQPGTVLRLRRFLDDLDSFTDFDLLLAAASTSDCEPILPVDFEELESLADELAGQQSRLFEDLGHARQLLDVGGRRLLSALKVALVLWRWTVLGDAEAVAEEDGCYPFEIVRLIESMERLLLAAASIRRGIDEPAPAEGEDEAQPAPKSETLLRIELLRQKILNGIEGPAASLTLVDGVGSSWARRLSEHGITDLAALAAAVESDLASLPKLGEKRAATWIKQAAERLLAIPPAVSGRRVPTLPPDTDLPVDPYRLRRAIELTVECGRRDRWTVTGGSEPRQVVRIRKTLTCSCPDHAKGNTCKHLLAIRLHLKDESILQAVRQVNAAVDIPFLDLFSLWFDRRHP